MQNKLLLVNGITLLYRESQLTGVNEKSSQLVREIIQSIHLPEINVGFDHERDILEGLKATALYMCETPPGYKYELNELLQRLRVDTLDEESLYEALTEGIVADLSEDAIKRTCLNIKRALNGHFKEEKIKDIVGKAAYTLKFTRNKISDMKAFVSELSSQLEPYMSDVINKDPAIITDVDSNNISQVTAVFDKIVDTETGLTILKLGSQGLNRMTDGGFRRGEFITLGGLQHNYKTGLSLTLFSQIARYNIPQLTNPKKKPLLVRITFEDTVEMNYQFLYRHLKENELGHLPDMTGVTSDMMADYVSKQLFITGYHTRLIQVNPSLWTYKDICNKILELEAEGYEIHMCMVDYLLKVPTTGCDGTAAGEPLRNMFERIKNFMAARGITFVTPHQLSTESKMMIRGGQSDFVKQLVGGGYYAGSKQLDQVIDLEIFFHIESVNGKSYLTIQRGKHRKVNQTPREHLHCVLPFNGDGGILEDIGKADTTCKKVGGGPIGSNDETPFWETEDKL